MSENPQVKAIREHTEHREHQLTAHAEQLRARIEELTQQFGEIGAEGENLRITREILLALPAPSPATEPERPDIPDHPGYQRTRAHVPHSERLPVVLGRGALP